MVVLLPELLIDSSIRLKASHKFIENFSFYTYNVNSGSINFIKSNMFPSPTIEGINNWLDFLKSDFRIEEYSKFGRPLIYGVFREKMKLNKYDLEAKFEDCEEFSFMG